MKNFLTAVFMGTFALSAHAIDISACEKFGEPGPRGDWVVKCEATEELTELQSGDATAMFLSVDLGLTTLATMITDNEHVYVNVVPGNCGPDTTGYRIFKQGLGEYKDGEMYAVSICE